MNNRTMVWILLGGGLLGLLLLTILTLVLTVRGGSSGGDFGFGGKRIQIVNIEGTLLDSRAFLDQLKRFEESDSVPAILLHIDSPGGDVATSQELYREIQRLREEKGKIVVAYMSSVGASGAYYVACAADQIVSNPGTIVGSIGVIGEWFNYGELLEWALISDVVFKTGEFKDTGSPTRAITPAEAEYFQSLIDDMYQQFIEAVAGGRNMSVAEVRGFADGRVFTGREAKELRLIDEIGNLQDAIDLTADLAGIAGRPELIEIPPPGLNLMDLLGGDLSKVFPFTNALTGPQLRFQYLWR